MEKRTLGKKASCDSCRFRSARTGAVVQQMQFGPTALSMKFITATLSICAMLFGCGHPSPPASNSVESMTLVAGATFQMGTDPAELEQIRAATGLPTIAPLMAEVPGRQVTVADFYLDTIDVTNRQYLKFVEARPGWRKGQLDSSLHNGRYLEHWVEGNPPAELLDHPVTFITWQAAVEYCTWRGKRLPTEIEYEWAAQDGVTPTEYPWGDSPPRNDLVNWGGNRIRKTVPVGSYPPNARGLYDMSGNVWRFLSDPWVGSYAEMLAGSTNLEQASGDPKIRRVVRGGSWGANAANL